jgi:hypothetical protein
MALAPASVNEALLKHDHADRSLMVTFTPAEALVAETRQTAKLKMLFKNRIYCARIHFPRKETLRPQSIALGGSLCSATWATICSHTCLLFPAPGMFHLQTIVQLPSFFFYFGYFLNLLCWGTHCGVYKSSYIVSNISYLNSPPDV